MVERLLPTPENRSSNLDVGKILSTNCTVKIEKKKIKKKRPGMAHLKKNKPVNFGPKRVKNFVPESRKLCSRFFIFLLLWLSNEFVGN